MIHQLYSALFVLGLLALDVVTAAHEKRWYINSTVESGIETACKTCPYELCTNAQVYPYYSEEMNEFYNNVTVLCWTKGDVVGGSDGNNIWLGTVDGCYVDQYDLVNYNGSYEHDLKFCGDDSENEFYTTQDATTAYDTECNINPFIDSDTLAYLPPDEDITVTCWTNGDIIIDDDIWARTTDLCYVAEKGLTDSIDKSSLDNCGPVPRLEVNTTDFDLHNPLPQHLSERNLNYLINVTVGNDYANCYEEPNIESDIVKSYPWLTEVFLQCITESNDPADPNNTYWELTTDFCYVRSADFWQSPEGDYYNFPDCSDFDQS